MGRPITRSTNAKTNAWRNKGFDDGYAGRAASPPGEEAARAPYMEGHRIGTRERAAEEAKS